MGKFRECTVWFNNDTGKASMPNEQKLLNHWISQRVMIEKAAFTEALELINYLEETLDAVIDDTGLTYEKSHLGNKVISKKALSKIAEFKEKQDE